MRQVRIVDPETAAPPRAAAVLVFEDGPAADALRASGAAELSDARPSGDSTEVFAREYADFLGALNAERASRSWWAFTLAGKNPVTSPLPRRCWQYRRFRAAAEATDHDLAVVTADQALADAIETFCFEREIEVSGRTRDRRTLRDILNALLPTGPVFGFLRALARLWAVRNACRWTPEAGKRYTVLATLVNHQSFLPSGAYRDTYFGDLSAELAKRGKDAVVFGSITHQFARSLRLSQEAAGAPVVPMERFAEFGDLLACLAEALGARLSRPRLSAPALFGGVDVTRFIERELAENVRASRHFSDLWYYHCLKAFLRGVPAEALYLPFENRCWERMLSLAFRESSPGAPVVGYQHASTTLNHLNYVLGAGEAKVLPLPDRVVTLGEVTRERLIGRGRFPAAQVVSGCALRQGPARAPRTGPASAKRILVTLATSVEEYDAVLRLLDKTFTKGEDVAVRPHPEFPLPETRFRQSRGTIAEAFDAADVVLYASSTLGLEAVRQGIPAIYLKTSDFLDMDPMYDFDALKWTARTPAELSGALSSVAALSDAELTRRRTEAAAYAARYFKAATDASLAPLLGTEPALAAGAAR